jgi:hypothetical protein
MIMDSEQLRALQAPLKDKYRAEPKAARVTLTHREREGTVLHRPRAREDGKRRPARVVRPDRATSGYHGVSNARSCQATYLRPDLC